MSTIDTKAVIKVLRDILTDLGKMGDDQFQALLEGNAKFKYFDPSELPAKKTGGKSTKKSSLSEERINEISQHLNNCKSESDAQVYLVEEKLTATEMQKIAKHLGIYLPSKKKDDIIAALTRGTIGAKLEYESIQRT